MSLVRTMCMQSVRTRSEQSQQHMAHIVTSLEQRSTSQEHKLRIVWRESQPELNLEHKLCSWKRRVVIVRCRLHMPHMWFGQCCCCMCLGHKQHTVEHVHRMLRVRLDSLRM